ncbi:MAG: multicopper oxidase family protein [Motilibacteraceae bacterium]
MVALTRRQLLVSAAGLAGAAALTGCSRSASPVTASSQAVGRAEAARKPNGSRVVNARLQPRSVNLDLGGPTVRTWGYGDDLPGRLLRVTAGDVLRVQVDNGLPADTTVHWHGLALRNDMDGVPGVTQSPIKPGASFTYEFTAPDPGTYFYHPHVGVQLDRGLYGPLIVDDPAEPGGYDHEWIVVLDDWVDGTGRTPDDVLAGFTGTGQSATPGGMGGMSMGGSSSTSSPGGMDMGGMSMGGGGGMGGMGESSNSPLLGGAGDVDYAYYLVNGRVPSAAQTFTARPGQRVRIRLINAGSDTAFRVALAGHRMRVTHTDGYPVQPVDADAVLIGMGERFDVEVTLADGVFPLVSVPEGKTGTAGRALVRTGGGPVPPVTLRPAELARKIVLGNDLQARPDHRLAAKPVDRSHDLLLAGSMMPYRWTINGRTWPDTSALPVKQGERVRLRYTNQSMMFHPMHLHGHTFELSGGGARKDTVIVRPMQSVDVELDANNPGQWVTHCHNIYHAETGMMTKLSYVS